MTEEYSLSLDGFELGILYGLVDHIMMYAEEDEKPLFKTIREKIIKIRRSMGKSPAN